MSRATFTPPRLARWLLNRVVPERPEGDTIRGDLFEDYAARRERSAAAAWCWYWIATLSILLRYRRTRNPYVDHARQPLQEALAQDVRYGVRRLIKAPAFTAVVLVTLGLGIGANTAIFSALNAVLLQPLPYPDAHRLVRLIGVNPIQGLDDSAISAEDFLDWQREARSFEALGAFQRYSTSIAAAGEGGSAERVAAVVETNLLPVLGVPPAAGRGFEAADVHPGAATAAIVSDGFAQRRFGGSTAAI